ncbi:hypothetical protein [Marinoscillum sp.]|uniref:hypothetical protein n=1 Tax=Marinoscillum sp. TaxID=2024838 RepID=UPI003BAB2FD1
MNRYLILKMTNSYIWYNETDGVDIDRTNLPMNFMTFSYDRPIYWKVRMERFHKDSKVLQVEIVGYNENDLNLFKDQQPKELIEGLEFIPRDNGELFIWDKLEPQLISYTKSKLTNHKKETYTPVNPFDSSLTTTYTPRSNETTKPAQREQTLDLSLKKEFSEVTIVLGGVRFDHHISISSKKVDFLIPNSHLLPEFDHIKFWFAKRLGVKKIPIKVHIKFKDGEITEVEAKSSLIDRIDEKLIHGVKVDRTMGLRKKLTTGTVDQSMFTAEEFFGSDQEEPNLGNVFGQTDKDLLDLFLENSDIRNRKELIYLSGKLHSNKHELRFTNHPHFGFIFFVEGKTENHFIWELLNSNATYIWSFDKYTGTNERHYQRMQEILNVILESGRENYKRAYRTQVQDQDLKFNHVKHQNKNSSLIDSFPLWKHRIEELLT